MPLDEDDHLVDNWKIINDEDVLSVQQEDSSSSDSSSANSSDNCDVTSTSEAINHVITKTKVGYDDVKTKVEKS